MTPGQDTGCGPRGTFQEGPSLALVLGAIHVAALELDMTRIFGILLTSLLLVPSLALAGDLTLRDVIELHRSGLGDDLLIAVIDADGGPFTLTFGDIQDLKSDGLSERVIAALVRTGSRRSLAADGGSAPVVHVQQEVNNYVAPTVVVVGVPGLGQGGRDQGRVDGHEQPRPPAPPPPAMWVTRREDGRNVTASGEVRTSVPAATWVTPRDPKPRDVPAAERPKPQ